MILSALTDYDLGYTLEETAARLRKKAHRTVSPSTHRVMARSVQGSTAPIAGFAPRASARFPANQTIRSIKLYHRQVYGYA